MVETAAQPTPKSAEKLATFDTGLSEVKHIVAVASGKGGVGKSTVSTNLAAALKQLGYRVGLMDADVYGPSVAKMMGDDRRPDVIEGQNMLEPLECRGIKFMSMALLTGAETPVIWRGPMATKLIQQFLHHVAWGELDYLIIDLPPGTGDVQLTLTQSVELTGAVIVTTPQEVAVGITKRGAKMFDQVHVPILGLVENMSQFTCPHCLQTTDIFSRGGGEAAAQEMGVPFLGAVPIDPAFSSSGDKGHPLMEEKAVTPTIQSIFHQIAKSVDKQTEHVFDLVSSTKVQIKDLKVEDQHVHIVWSDLMESHLPFRDLRLACPCAHCIDEWTGEARLDPETVPQDVHPTNIQPIGRYALKFSWSDGHYTGLYPFERLREHSAQAV